MDKETNNDMTWPKGHKPKEGSTENLATRFGLIANIALIANLFIIISSGIYVFRRELKNI